MPNGDVLHPFAPGSVEWDELWLEQDNGRALREFAILHRDKEQSAADKAAVNEICVFFMKMKANAHVRTSSKLNGGILSSPEGRPRKNPRKKSGVSIPGTFTIYQNNR